MSKEKAVLVSDDENTDGGFDLKDITHALQLSKKEKTPKHRVQNPSQFKDQVLSKDYEEKEDIHCLICLSNKRNVACIPCGHIVSCIACAIFCGFLSCPVCLKALGSMLATG